MPVNRLERVNALLKRVIGEAVFRVMQTDDVSPGLITVTGVTCGKDLRNATVHMGAYMPMPAVKFRSVLVDNAIFHVSKRQFYFRQKCPAAGAWQQSVRCG